MSFETRGFNLIGVFDNSPSVIGQVIQGVQVKDVSSLDEFCRMHEPTVAILCIPKNAAQELADHLIELGIKGFWNFSHYDISINSSDVVVENVHLGDSLMTLCYRVNEILSEPA